MSLLRETRVQRVLVVDDDRDGAEMLAELIDLWGFQTRFALDGRSAMIAAQVFEPQLILLDVGLPDMDGYEIARQLRRQPNLARVVLVALTGWSGPERELRAREAGFDDYIVKPIQPSSLERLLKIPTRSQIVPIA